MILVLEITEAVAVELELIAGLLEGVSKLQYPPKRGSPNAKTLAQEPGWFAHKFPYLPIHMHIYTCIYTYLFILACLLIRLDTSAGMYVSIYIYILQMHICRYV